ncbi:MAG TPA: hypothetical protein VGA25_00275 [Burkholderiales bacterium]
MAEIHVEEHSSPIKTPKQLVKAGMSALYASSIKGKNAMPPKGGNLALPDADVRAAVDYMVGLVK